MITKKELKEMRKGLVCLVPLPGKAGITCHERTLCDCEVLKIIETFEETIVRMAKAFEAIYKSPSFAHNRRTAHVILKEFNGGKDAEGELKIKHFKQARDAIRNSDPAPLDNIRFTNCKGDS